MDLRTFIFREKQSFELYSTFYENLLRHHHHLLYQKEREIEMVRLKSSEATGSRINAQVLAHRSINTIILFYYNFVSYPRKVIYFATSYEILILPLMHVHSTRPGKLRRINLSITFKKQAFRHSTIRLVNNLQSRINNSLCDK